MRCVRRCTLCISLCGNKLVRSVESCKCFGWVGERRGGEGEGEEETKSMVEIDLQHMLVNG